MFSLFFGIRGHIGVICSFGPYRLDTDRLELWCGEEAVSVEPQVFGVLCCLVENRDRVVSKEELIERVWDGRFIADATLSARISAARRAVGDNGKDQAIIRTVAKRGFRFVAEACGQTDSTADPSVRSNHTLTIRPLKIAGDEGTEFLAEGLREGLLNSMSRHAAIIVIPEPSPPQNESDFALEGSVRGHGDRVRLTFSLIDSAKGHQIWSERYDRTVGDVFALEEEISRAVAAAVRVKLKEFEFEPLRDTRDDELSVPDLLNKAAGIFCLGPGNNDKAEASLRLALAREPRNSMAAAMLSFCMHRGFEYTPLAPPADALESMLELAERAISLNAESYFAHLVEAIIAQDLRGDFMRAAMHAQAALNANPDLLGGHGMIGIAKCHLGEPEAGIAILKQILDGNREDPHRFRHQRELAIASFIAGDAETATDMIGRLVESEPQMDRNRLVQAALLWLAGDSDSAIAAAHYLRGKYPDLSISAKRLTSFGQSEVASRFEEAFAAIGLGPGQS